VAPRFRTLLGRACALLVCAGVLGSSPARAESTPAAPAAPVPDASEARDWSIAGSLYTYFLPDQTAYAQPTVSGSWRWLHAEARYNYEAQRTASLWLGCTLGLGEKVTFDLTMMAAAVFGDVVGFAPGMLAELNWRWLRLYVEAEYLFDSRSPSDSFFYTWSELTLAPLDWLFFGLVLQRTRAYPMEMEVQRGFLLGLTREMFYVTGHLFDPFGEPLGVLAFGAEF
jgi:hypothetical protein